MAADWVWPNGTKTMPHVSSPFGPRKPFQTSNGAWASSNHKGVDFTGFSIVRSVTDGVVEKVGTPAFWGGGGHQVWVRNYDGSLSRYFHLRAGSHLVRVGQHVHAGQALGRMGATGNALGVHLHLELVPKGRSAQVDPIPYIRARLGAAAGGGGNVTVKRPVKDIQRLVGATPDGIYGPDTVTKVKAWQKANGLFPDGVWGPASDARGFPTNPAPVVPEPEEEEEDGMYKPTVHVRTEGPFEATLAHPDIGADLEQHTGPGTGGKRTQGAVTVYRGFMVTADRDIAVAWARTHAKGSGGETSRTDRAGYIAIQVEASRIAAELG